MQKTILLIITTALACILSSPRVNGEPDTILKKYRGSVSIIDLSVQVTAAYSPDKKLYIYVITIGFLEENRLISVSQGKTDGSYLVTMEFEDILGKKYLQTFILDFKREDFLKFVAREHDLLYKKGIKKEAIELREDLILTWKPQPLKSFLQEN